MLPVGISRRRRSVRFIIHFCSFLSVRSSGSHQYSESRQKDWSTPRTLKEQRDEKWSLCVFIINNISPLTAATALKSAHKSAGASTCIVKWPRSDFYQRKCSEINSACDKCHSWLISFLFPAFSFSLLRKISRPSQARSKGIRGTFPVFIICILHSPLLKTLTVYSLMFPQMANLAYRASQFIDKKFLIIHPTADGTFPFYFFQYLCKRKNPVN